MFHRLKVITAMLIAGFISFQALPVAAGSIGSGTFTGKSNHVTKGGVEVVKNADGSHTVVLADNFFFDGAPDPRVGFGNNGKYDKSTGMGLLTKLTGKQSYTVPAGVDPSKYNEVYIYCLKFNVPLGVAKIN